MSEDSKDTLDSEYEEATRRALHGEAEEKSERNRQDYSMYVDDWSV